jgi:hypothetical protein
MILHDYRKWREFKVGETRETIDPYLVKSSPPVISIGMRCVDDGYQKVKHTIYPYMIKPNSERIELVVRDCVPYLANNSKMITTPSTQQRPSITVPASAEAQQSPENNGEIEVVGDEPIDFPEPQPLLTEAVEEPDADRKVEPPDELKVVAVVSMTISMSLNDHLGRKR